MAKIINKSKGGDLQLFFQTISHNGDLLKQVFWINLLKDSITSIVTRTSQGTTNIIFRDWGKSKSCLINHYPFMSLAMGFQRMITQKTSSQMKFSYYFL